MAFKNYKKKKTYRKKRGSRRKGRRGGYRQVSISRSPVSMRVFNRLRYSEQIQLNPGIGTVAKYEFCANGLFDPNLTGVGHQPLGFDQWMTFYHHYCVLGSRIRVDFINGSATSQYVVGCAILPQAGLTLSQDTIRERSNQKYRTISVATGGSNRCNMTLNFSTKKFNGGVNPLTRDDLKGNDFSNPTETSVFYVYAESTDGVTDPDPIDCTISIQYICCFFEPRQLTGS